MNNTLEKDIEQSLRKLVEKRGGMCLKWVCPGWSGVPDRIVLLPGGRVIFVETKRPKGGELSRLQIWWGERLRALGFDWWTVWNNKDLTMFDLYIKTEKLPKPSKGSDAKDA